MFKRKNKTTIKEFIVLPITRLNYNIQFTLVIQNQYYYVKFIDYIRS